MEYSAYSLLVSSFIILSFSHPSLSSVVAKAKITGFTLDVIPIYDLHMIKLKIGTPPTEAYAIIETGSDLVGFNCTACENCTQQGIPSYDPNKSTSYSHPDDWNSTACQSLLAEWRGIQDTCRYVYWYQEGYSDGILSREKIYIPLGSGGGGQIASFPNFVFGCGLDNDMDEYNKFHVGIVGLNMGHSSLISQLGIQKFAYCLSDPASLNSSGKIMFGDDVISDGSVPGVVTTPIEKTGIGRAFDEFFYYVNLEGATVVGARSRIYIPNKGNFDSKIILSTGVTPTYLREDFYYNLEVAVKNATNLVPVESWLCYNEYPEIEIVFHFTGADVTLKRLNLFRKDYRGLICFLMFPVDPPRDDDDNHIGSTPYGDDTTIPLWGNLAQLNFQVTYDLANKLVSFAPTDCAKL